MKPKRQSATPTTASQELATQSTVSGIPKSRQGSKTPQGPKSVAKPDPSRKQKSKSAVPTQAQRPVNPEKIKTTQAPAANQPKAKAPKQKKKAEEATKAPVLSPVQLLASIQRVPPSSIADEGPSVASVAGRTEPVPHFAKSQGDVTETLTEDSEVASAEVFRIATATPIPISSTIEEQFYESLLLLYVLERVRGEHSKRQSYHGELEQDSIELRRSFTDKLAYICDYRRGGSTVTAVALQKTYQGVTLWLAANETVKQKVVDFLRGILQSCKNMEAGTKALEDQLLARIVAFNDERLEHYWAALKNHLSLCFERLDLLKESTKDKNFKSDLNSLKDWLERFRSFSDDRVKLVQECFKARKSPNFQTLGLLTASGTPNSRFFDDIRHLIGRLGEHLKATKTLILAALRFPAILDDFKIQVQVSPPSRCPFQSARDIKIDGLAGRIFSKQDEISLYQNGLEDLQRTSDGALLEDLRENSRFKTCVHAETTLVDLFYLKGFEFLDDDPYIGCSKPACFNCYHYILAHPGNFILPACHNKLYLTWRPPDILKDSDLHSHAVKIREHIMVKMNSNTRSELRRQIDGRCSRKLKQYDSVTGTSSSVTGARFPLSKDQSSDLDGSSEPLSKSAIPGSPSSIPTSDKNHEAQSPVCQPPEVKGYSQSLFGEDSDDDLDWYKGRLQRFQLA